MSDGTKIEWSEATWNVVTGCTRVSAGCDHCYIERTPPFRMQHRKFDGEGVGTTTGVKLHSERLHRPLRWRKPRRVFVNSLADLFHDEVPDRFIAETFAVMCLAPQHTFQLLTKRHARMRSLLGSHSFWTMFQVAMLGRRRDGAPISYDAEGPHLRNVWVGVSVENQQWAELRVPALLDTPAAVRWLSCEPLLGPVDLVKWLNGGFGTVAPADLDWLVAGGESGPGARPMHPDWARSLRDQCTAAGVPFFFKQHGAWAPIGPLYGDSDETDDAHMDAVQLEVEEKREVVQMETTGHIAHGYQPADPCTWLMARVGKKAAGRELDGRTWDEYPEEVSC